MIKRIFLYLFTLILISTSAWATTWYVRPSGGSYGGEDGTAYADAWDGFSNITWGVGGVVAGDTLYIAGSHTEQFDMSEDGSEGNVITIRGDYGGDHATVGAPTSGSWTMIIRGDYVSVINFDSIISKDASIGGRAISISGTNVTVDGCTITGPGSGASNSGAVGIRIDGADSIITNNDISHVNTGINYYAYNATGGFGGTCDSNTLHDLDAPLAGNADCIGISGESPGPHDYSGLVISKNSCSEFTDDGIDLYFGSNIIVEYNKIGPYTTADSGGDGNGIKCGGSPTGGSNVIRYNLIYGLISANQDVAINLNGASNLEIYGNIAYECSRGITGVTTAAKIYNNTFADMSERGIYISGGIATTHYLKNNITDGTDYDIKLGSVMVVEGGFNILKNDSSVSVDGTYNGSGDDLYQTAPGFTNAGNDDYTLALGSAAIDAGADLTATYDDALDPDSTWPDGVATLDQDLFGAGWDIGAFVYDLFISSASPTGPGIGLDTDLNWTNPTGTVTVDVYFEEVSGACDLLIGDRISTGTLITTKDQGAMTIDTSYCWRVDVIHAGGTETGVVYEFTTTGGPPPPPAGLATCVYDASGMTGVYDDQGATVH